MHPAAPMFTVCVSPRFPEAITACLASLPQLLSNEIPHRPVSPLLYVPLCVCGAVGGLPQDLPACKAGGVAQAKGEKAEGRRED